VGQVNTATAGSEYQHGARRTKRFPAKSRRISAPVVLAWYLHRATETNEERGKTALLRPSWNLRGVSWVGKLARQEPAVLLGEFDRFIDHTGSAFGSRGQYHLSAKSAHYATALNAERFCHRDDERVTFGGTDHRKGDTSVAAGGFDNRLTGFESTCAKVCAGR